MDFGWHHKSYATLYMELPGLKEHSPQIHEIYKFLTSFYYYHSPDSEYYPKKLCNLFHATGGRAMNILRD